MQPPEDPVKITSNPSDEKLSVDPEFESDEHGSNAAETQTKSAVENSKSAARGSHADRQDAEPVAHVAESFAQGKNESDVTFISDMAAHGRTVDALKQSATGLVGKTL